MKRGGQLIYNGSLGPLSTDMIKYFEVSLQYTDDFILRIRSSWKKESINVYSVTGYTWCS
jgi:hypothetical protein